MAPDYYLDVFIIDNKYEESNEKTLYPDTSQRQLCDFI